MSVCLYEMPDSDVKANAFEIWANDYSADLLWICDDDENAIYMTRDEAVLIAAALQSVLEDTA